MPTYLIHGFRWQRSAIRIHIAKYRLDDAAADWIMAPTTSITIYKSFHELWDILPPEVLPPNDPPNDVPTTSRSTSENKAPSRTHDEDVPSRSLMKRMTSRASISTLGRKQKPLSIASGSRGKGHMGTATAEASNVGQSPHQDDRGGGGISANIVQLPRFNEWCPVKLLEEWDLNEQYKAYQEHAYVGDYLVEVTLGAALSEHAEKYQEWISGVKEGAWIEKLKKNLQPEADIGWYVVVCGDVDRFAPESTDSSTDDEGDAATITSNSKTGGRKSLFRKRSVDFKQGIPDEQPSAPGNDSRVSDAEHQLQLVRKQLGGNSPKPSPAIP